MKSALWSTKWIRCHDVWSFVIMYVGLRRLQGYVVLIYMLNFDNDRGWVMFYVCMIVVAGFYGL